MISELMNNPILKFAVEEILDDGFYPIIVSRNQQIQYINKIGRKMYLSLGYNETEIFEKNFWHKTIPKEKHLIFRKLNQKKELFSHQKLLNNPIVSKDGEKTIFVNIFNTYLNWNGEYSILSGLHKVCDHCAF